MKVRRLRTFLSEQFGFEEADFGPDGGVLSLGVANRQLALKPYGRMWASLRRARAPIIDIISASPQILLSADLLDRHSENHYALFDRLDNQPHSYRDFPFGKWVAAAWLNNYYTEIDAGDEGVIWLMHNQLWIYTKQIWIRN